MSRRYVVAELHGRLGNQLFQFASAYALARRRDARLVFTVGAVAPQDLLLPELLGERYEEADRRELLGVGKLAYAIPPRRATTAFVYHGSRAWRRLRRRTPPSVTFWDDTGRYRPGLFELDLPVYVQGHLQSERYFADYAAEVAAAIAWPARTNATAPECPVVGVSFRAGDYEPLGWTLPLDYYAEALACVVARVPDARVLLFGDDEEFVMRGADRLRGIDARIDTQYAGADPLVQLRRLSECDHVVIANSSFAWWGAWLGDQRARAAGAPRIVVAPLEYGAGSDRLPSRWATIETGAPVF